MPVAVGTPLFTLRNVGLEKEMDSARTQLSIAQVTAREAELHGGNMGEARADLVSDVEHYRTVAEEAQTMQVASPIAGNVVTTGLNNLTGSFVEKGAELIEIDGLQNFRARIYIPEFQLHRMRLGAEVSLKPEALFRSIHGTVDSLAPASSEMAPGLVHREQYAGTVGIAGKLEDAFLAFGWRQ